MNHRLIKVLSFDFIKPFALKINFSDSKTQVVDFAPILKGEIYGPLNNEALFRQASIDPEIGTIVWPNGADFDPALLYDWEDVKEELAMRANTWE